MEEFLKVKRVIVDQLGVDEDTVTMDSSFVDDLGADSLDIVELIMGLETEFDLEIPDEEAEAPAEAASQHLLREQLSRVLSTLSPREELVLKLRFGLGGDRPHTLEEVGEEFNITRERIRQIEAKALRKMRHPSRSRPLKDYLG